MKADRRLWETCEPGGAMKKSDADPMHAANAAPRCRAESKRSGKPCRAPAVQGWKVCRMHGARGGSNPAAPIRTIATAHGATRLSLCAIPCRTWYGRLVARETRRLISELNARPEFENVLLTGCS